MKLLIALSLAHSAASICEQWCEFSCCDLNGDVEKECFTCDPEKYLCAPGKVSC